MFLFGPPCSLFFCLLKKHVYTHKGIGQLGAGTHEDLLLEPSAPQHANYLEDVHDLTSTHQDSQSLIFIPIPALTRKYHPNCISLHIY